jgi:ABC-type sugar transport system substrate-binding protein
MKLTKHLLTRRDSISAIVASALVLALTAGTGIAQDKKSDVRIGFTPKFLKDDFQTLMLNLSKKAFDAKGFTLVGAPDPNGDIAAQVRSPGPERRYSRPGRCASEHDRKWS